MATFEITEITNHEVTVRISNFDPTYVESLRGLYFSHRYSDEESFENDYNTAIPAGFNSAINYTYSNLDSDTTYDFKVVIGNVRGNSNVEWIGSAKTKATYKEPEISSFSCYPDAENSTDDKFIVKCWFAIRNYNTGVSYEIYARQSGTTTWYLKSGNDIYSSEFDDTKEPAEGEVSLYLYNEELQASKLYDFKLVIYDKGKKIDEGVVEDVFFEQNWITEIEVEHKKGDEWYERYITFDLRRPLPVYATIDWFITDENGKKVIMDMEEALSLGSSVEEYDIYNFYDSDSKVFDSFYLAIGTPGKYRCYFEVRTYNSKTDMLNGNNVEPVSYVDTYFNIQYPTPSIGEFIVWQPEDGIKTVKCNIGIWPLSYIRGITSYKIYARKYGDDIWYLKDEGVRNEDENYFSVYINTDDFGSYEFKLVVYNDTKSNSETDSCYLGNVESDKPIPWEWSKTYTDISGNQNVTLSANAYVPVVGKEIRPVTAGDWNDFTQRINQTRVYSDTKGNGIVTGLYTGFSVVKTGDDFTPSIYNQAVSAIKGIAGGGTYGGYLKQISDTTELNAYIFEILRDELNAAINDL